MTNIKPFRIDVPQADLDDLRNRLANTRWPQQLPGTSWERGVPVDYLRDLAEYWGTDYDWRRHEAELNSYPQFTTEIDGQNIHFLHIRSPHEDALPLVITHGWPASIVEFMDVIEPLTNPANPADAFHLVIPSLPGFGFSTPLQPGWGNLFRVAAAWAELMNRLGYERYAVQGGDVGAGVAGMLGMVAADKVVGIHINGPGPAPFGPPVELEDLSDADRVRGERFNQFQQDGMGYLQMQSTRPQTIAYSLHDSPVGQLAWIVEKFGEWTDPARELPDDAVDRDRLLTNISLYWLTGTGSSAAHFTYEGMQAFREFVAQQAAAQAAPAAEGWGGEAAEGEGGQDWAAAGPPTGVAVFAADHSIRKLVDPAGAYTHWNEYDSGGHFPAMEVPELLTEDVRTFFRGLR